MIQKPILSVRYPVHLYRQNGSGRDGYIAINNGGNTLPLKRSGVVKYGPMVGKLVTDRSESPPPG